MVIAYELRPAKLYLNVTNRCSNDCVFCVRRRPGFSIGGFDMRLPTEPDARELLAEIARQEQARAQPFEEVVFCGFGEPTMRLELVHEVGRALRGRGVRVRLDTNGQAALLCGRDPVPELVAACDAVSISLNAPSAERYLALCQPRFGAPAYEALRSLAAELRMRVGELTLSVVGHVLEPAEIAACEAIADELGASFRIR